MLHTNYKSINYCSVLNCDYFCWLLHLTSDPLCPLCSRPVDEERLRPVTQLDLLFGLDKMKESKRATALMLPMVSEVPLD